MQKSQTPQSRYLLTHLSELQSVGIFSLKDNNVISYQKNSAHNPLHHCAELQCYLVENAEKQTVPYICKDDYQAYFVCIKHQMRTIWLAQCARFSLIKSKDTSSIAHMVSRKIREEPSPVYGY